MNNHFYEQRGSGSNSSEGSLKASVSPATDSNILESIQELTQQILAIDSGNNHSEMDISTVSEEYLNFKVKTKTLLEQLFAKLEENSRYEKSLEHTVDNLRKEMKFKEDKLQRLTQYVESFIEKCATDADEKCKLIATELQDLQKEKTSIEKMVVKLTAENRKLKDEVNLLRIAESGTTNPASAKAHMTDMIYENEDLKEKVARLEEDLVNLKLQRDAEMLSVMNVIREFENIIRGNVGV